MVDQLSRLSRWSETAAHCGDDDFICVCVCVVLMSPEDRAHSKGSWLTMPLTESIYLGRMTKWHFLVLMPEADHQGD